MAHWVRLTLPAAAVAVAPSAYAVQYLSIEAAQKLAFPSASRFVQSGGAAWKAQAGDKVIGLFVVDHVIGKHLYIDYAVALDTSGRVMRVDILQYRESYGGELREPVAQSCFHLRHCGGGQRLPQLTLESGLAFRRLR